MSPKIAFVIPCYNEAVTIADVVAQAKAALPAADVYVYDNNSTDGSADITREAGAIVRHVRKQGKGSVVRRMFADIDADIYVMTDGDLTYDVKETPRLIDLLIDGRNDMVVGTRVETVKEAYPLFHRFGNAFLTGLVRMLFGIKQTDMLSGFRVFSKRFAKTFPARSNGFEIETELNVFTAMNDLPFAEAPTDYFARPAGSFRKLSTFKDGFKIAVMIARLITAERPALLFGVLSFLNLCALGIGFWFHPDAFITECWLFCGFWFFLFCTVLCGVSTRFRREAVRLSYLSYPFIDEAE